MARTLRIVGMIALLGVLAGAAWADSLIPAPLTLGFKSSATSYATMGYYDAAGNDLTYGRYFFGNNGPTDVPVNLGYDNGLGTGSLNGVYWGASSNGFHGPNDGVFGAYAGMTMQLSAPGEWQFAKPANQTSQVTFTSAPVVVPVLTIWDTAHTAYVAVTFQLQGLRGANNQVGAGGSPLGRDPDKHFNPPQWDLAGWNLDGVVTGVTYNNVASTNIGFNQIRTQLVANWSRSRVAFIFDGQSVIPSDGRYSNVYQAFVYVNPEPSFYGLLGLGMTGLFAFAWRRRRSSQN